MVKFEHRVRAAAAAGLLTLALAAPALAQEQRVTFGMQCRFDDGLKVSLIATRQDNRFMMFREVAPHQSRMVYLTVEDQGHLSFEGENDAASEQGWRDAFGILKKLPLETIQADHIDAFVGKPDVAPCGKKTFLWREAKP